MSRMIKMTVFVVLVVGVLTGAAFAFATFLNVQGTVDRYDFGSFGQGYPIPGTIEIQGFNMQPGDVVPWFLGTTIRDCRMWWWSGGNPIEQEVSGINQCSVPTQDRPGAAFIEPPGRIHTLYNPGPGSAQIFWATVFPKGDPDGDAVFVNPPACN